MRGKTHHMLPSGVLIDARLPRLGPIWGKGIIARLPPVVEDLVGDLGNHLGVSVRAAGIVGTGDLGLGNSDARVLVEEADETEDSRNGGGKENDEEKKGRGDRHRLEPET